MSADACPRKLLAELLEQVTDGGTLFGGTGVLRPSLGIQAADVADSYGGGVMAAYMGTYRPNGAPRMDRSVGIDYVVIADLFITGLPVPSVDIPDRYPLPFFCRAAMQHDVCNFSHVV